MTLRELRGLGPVVIIVAVPAILGVVMALLLGWIPLLTVTILGCAIGYGILAGVARDSRPNEGALGIFILVVGGVILIYVPAWVTYFIRVIFFNAD